LVAWRVSHEGKAEPQVFAQLFLCSVRGSKEKIDRRAASVGMFHNPLIAPMSCDADFRGDNNV
jgi:hypothetical protein